MNADPKPRAGSQLVWTSSGNHVAFSDDERLATLAADSAARWFGEKL